MWKRRRKTTNQSIMRIQTKRWNDANTIEQPNLFKKYPHIIIAHLIEWASYTQEITVSLSWFTPNVATFVFLYILLAFFNSLTFIQFDFILFFFYLPLLCRQRTIRVVGVVVHSRPYPVPTMFTLFIIISRSLARSLSLSSLYFSPFALNHSSGFSRRTVHCCVWLPVVCLHFMHFYGEVNPDSFIMSLCVCVFIHLCFCSYAVCVWTLRLNNNKKRFHCPVLVWLSSLHFAPYSLSPIMHVNVRCCTEIKLN